VQGVPVGLTEQSPVTEERLMENYRWWCRGEAPRGAERRFTSRSSRQCPTGVPG